MPVTIKETKELTGEEVKWEFKKLGLYFYECPKTAITERTWSIVSLLSTFDEKDTPFPGCYMEQPMWYREARQIFKQVKMKFDEAEAANKKTKKAN